MKVFHGDWDTEDGFRSMVSDFSGCYEWSDGTELAEAMKEDRYQGDYLFAAYVYQNYEGDAFVLFKRDGKLYEVNGGHCSCYGLAESSISGDGPSQWEPEETSKEAVLKRMRDDGYGIFGAFQNEIRAALEAA
jgi:hypothetical protein